MSISREELAAWADGEITGERGEEIARAVEADPHLHAQVEAHRALKARLGAHFAPRLADPVPERLTALLTGGVEEKHGAPVVSLANARDRRKEKRRLPRWSYVAGPALAASLALAVFWPGGLADTPDGYAGSQLAVALDSQLVAEQRANTDTRILLSFRNDAKEFCRAFSSEDTSGIACRDSTGWRFEMRDGAMQRGASEYRQAGADGVSVMQAAQDMASGGALDAAAEADARDAGWR